MKAIGSRSGGKGAAVRRRVWGMLMLAALGGAQAQAQEFQSEQLKDGGAIAADVIPMYVADFSIKHLMDGRVRVLDQRNGRYAGVIDSGYAGQFSLAPDGKQAYVDATYLSRHSHGTRSDVLEIYDPATLRMTGDVELPARRAQGIYTRELMRPSSDGHYVYVQNATPSTSVTVVDVQQRKVLTEVPTPGCWALFPSQTQPLRFSALCGDGTVMTFSLNEDGSVARRASTPGFFDSDKDPIYIVAADDGESYYFLSFLGKLTQITLTGEQPVIGASRMLVPDKDARQGWRPGGYQLMALHRASGRLFIGMHAHGAEGSHKTPAQEIWTFDLHSGKRLARTRVSNFLSISVNQGKPGYLFGIDADSNRVQALDLDKNLKRVWVSAPAGDVPILLETP
jgi:methylamine dehydrogenase heavy chain